LESIQKRVDAWINQHGGYFSELTNLAILMEETGEVARLMSRIYGDQSFKSGETENARESLKGEFGDLLFILICLANQLDISLDDAIEITMRKNSVRDAQRHSKTRH
jgi:NTP pyrophosphatase (non-canonical NTP hydrolase)